MYQNLQISDKNMNFIHNAVGYERGRNMRNSLEDNKMKITLYQWSRNLNATEACMPEFEMVV